ncbi:uncharacterized protein TNCT_244731 [Trichonephila clavata]|uniref:Shugoshin C-terminal domain-containing protein n=1 Tax=Trichonephila clavata TaxID=2740835 RepID=A0A8X6J9B3_TRICU|nr:uncharacterized protein TNCT_244731 [Trichonephila clavata]
MATTVQKLVTDLDEVSNYMDGKTFDFLKGCSLSHDDVRLKILVPNITTIEESASTSTIEADISKDERINYENAIGSVGAESKLKTRTSPRQNLMTEICHLPLQAVSQDFSGLSGNERPRVSKSPEHHDSSSVDISKTPQPPVIPPNFRLRSSAASQNFLDLLKLHSQDTPSPSIVKQSPKVTTSKIPKRIPTSTTIDCPQPSVPLSQFSRRETFVVKSINDEPQIPVSSTDRRGTFLLNPAGDNQLNDRRATFLIPVQPKDPIPSPPKETEANPEVIVRNETVFLCEDMELTEILPVQNQFLPFQKVWSGEMESEGFTPIEKSPNVEDHLTGIAAKQISANTELEKSNSAVQQEMPKLESIIKPCLSNSNQTMDLEKAYHNKISGISNILSEEKEFKLSIKGVNKEIDIAKDGGFIDSNKISHSETLKSVPTTDEQIQEPKLIEEYDVKSVIDKTKLLEENLLGKDLISDIENVSSKKKSRVSSITKKNSGSTKLSDRISDIKARLTSCKNQSTTRSSKSPRQSRRSCKKQSMNFDKTSDDEFDESFAEDFTERKKFPFKLGRKIINPNNKRTFVFTKQQNIDQNIPTDFITSSSSDVAANEDNNIFDFSASSEAEKSPVMKPKKQSRKAKKSILPKPKNSRANKHSHTDKELEEKDIHLDDVFETKKKAKILPRKSILCINKDLNSQQSYQSSRKSVRFTLKDAENTRDSSNSSFEINLASSEIESNKEIQEHAEQLSEDYYKSKDKKLHSKKKYCSGRSSSLKATGDIVKNTNIKITNSKKQLSCSSSSDSLETNLEIIEIPVKKNAKVSQKFKTSNKGIKINKDNCVYSGNSVNLNSEENVEKEPVITQENSSKIMSKAESDLDVDGKINQSPKENDIKIKKTKLKRTFSGVSNHSSRKRSTLDDGLTDLDGAILSNETLSEETKENDIKTKKAKVKRTFSGVSNRSSKKGSTLGDDFLSDLDNAIFSRGTLSKETKMPENLLTEEQPTEIYNVNDLMKLGAVKTSKERNLEEKTLHNQGISSKKDNLNIKNVLVEIQPDNYSDVTQAKKVRTVAKKKCNPKLPHNKVPELDILACNDDTELLNSKNLLNNAAEKCNVPGIEKNVEKSKSKKSRKRIRNENEDPNSVNVRNVKSDVLSKDLTEDLKPLPLLQNRCASDIPCSTSPLVILEDDEGRRPRRTRPVKSFKEPPLNTKMRR